MGQPAESGTLSPAMHMASSVAREVCPFCMDRKLYSDILCDIRDDNIIPNKHERRENPAVENGILSLENSLHETFSNRLLSETLEETSEEV